MTDHIRFTIDGTEITARSGQTILEAAQQAGIYIPHLCHHGELIPHGSCRVCTVKVNGRFGASCTQPVAPGMIVENGTEELERHRRWLVEMLFAEGNHFCMFCERSGNCELQALAYRLGITAPRHRYLFPDRHVDATGPAVLLERNRCILCARCVRASHDCDGKSIFGFVNRGKEKQLSAGAWNTLGETACEATDRAVALCPVGALLRKHTGYLIPVGKRLYDKESIGGIVKGGTPQKEA